MANAQPKMSASHIEQKLKELGITLPQPAVPVASYVPFVVVGDMVYISGQLPVLDGKMQYQGKLGADISIDDGASAARLCALNLIAQLKSACGGDLNRVARCVKLTGFVNGVDGFADQPKVMNGASNLMVDVFGELGKHARAAVGTNSLPFNVCVEVEGVFQIRPDKQ